MGAYTAAVFETREVPARELESSVAGRAAPIQELDDIDVLFQTHRARLLRFITCTTGDQDLAETIAQDALFTAYNGRENFRGECSVSTWLTGIAINLLRDHQRSQRYKFWKKVKSSAVDVSEMAAFLPTEGSGPEKQLLAKEKVKHLARVLETLSPNQRMVFVMKFSEEMPVAGISEVLGMTEATVQTHLHRALTAVRSRLGAKT